MIERRAGRLCVLAPMVMANARSLLDSGRAALLEAQETFDLEGVPEADSSALAVMLGWLRTAEARGTRLAFCNAPAGLRSLAELYRLTDILPLV